MPQNRHHTGKTLRSILWVFIMGESAYKSPEEAFAFLPKCDANQQCRVIPPAYEKELCPRPNFPIIRYRGRYLKCSDADFFEAYIDPQLGRSARPRTASERQRWQTL
jgi:hypothetical protein